MNRLDELQLLADKNANEKTYDFRVQYGAGFLYLQLFLLDRENVYALERARELLLNAARLIPRNHKLCTNVFIAQAIVQINRSRSEYNASFIGFLNHTKLIDRKQAKTWKNIYRDTVLFLSLEIDQIDELNHPLSCLLLLEILLPLNDTGMQNESWQRAFRKILNLFVDIEPINFAYLKVISAFEWADSMKNTLSNDKCIMTVLRQCVLYNHQTVVAKTWFGQSFSEFISDRIREAIVSKQLNVVTPELLQILCALNIPCEEIEELFRDDDLIFAELDQMPAWMIESMIKRESPQQLSRYLDFLIEKENLDEIELERVKRIASLNAPYLREKAKWVLFFCGVGDDPGDYYCNWASQRQGDRVVTWIDNHTRRRKNNRVTLRMIWLEHLWIVRVFELDQGNPNQGKPIKLISGGFNTKNLQAIQYFPNTDKYFLLAGIPNYIQIDGSIELFKREADQLIHPAIPQITYDIRDIFNNLEACEISESFEDAFKFVLASEVVNKARRLTTRGKLNQSHVFDLIMKWKNVFHLHKLSSLLLEVLYRSAGNPDLQYEALLAINECYIEEMDAYIVPEENLQDMKDDIKQLLFEVFVYMREFDEGKKVTAEMMAPVKELLEMGYQSFVPSVAMFCIKIIKRDILFPPEAAEYLMKHYKSLDPLAHQDAELIRRILMTLDMPPELALNIKMRANLIDMDFFNMLDLYFSQNLGGRVNEFICDIVMRLCHAQMYFTANMVNMLQQVSAKYPDYQPLQEVLKSRADDSKAMKKYT